MKTLKLSVSNQSESIFLISDVHSNFPALEAVLNEISNDALIICAGDIVGYYLDSNEVCSLLQERSVLCVMGNHDHYVLGDLEYPNSRESKYRITPTRQMLTNENRKWLENLPDAIFLEIDHSLDNSLDTSSMLITHGSPRSVEEYVYPDTPIDFITEDSPTYTILGHTHHPMMRQECGRLVVNPGSVGQVRDRIPGASYASINPISGNVSFHRAVYPIESYQQRLKNAGVTDSMINILSREK